MPHATPKARRKQLSTREDHLVRFGAYAFAARQSLIRARRLPPGPSRRSLLLLARADGQSARHHWQQFYLP